MKYLVMECHLSYAIVLDENGEFLHVANKNYAVGQTVTDVFELPYQKESPAKKANTRNKWIASFAAMAACLLLAASVLFQSFVPYASVYISINPEIRIDVNKKDIVVGIEGINADGKILIEQYDYKNKHLDFVVDEMVDRAIEMGYLFEGGKITLLLDAKNGEWIVSKNDALATHLNEYISDDLSITVEVADKNANNSPILTPNNPNNEVKDSDYNDSDYDDSNYDDSDYNTSDYDDKQSDYHISDYQSSDYDDTNESISDYEYSDDAQSDYGESDYENDNEEYGNSDYEGSDYTDYEDSNSDYSSSDYSNSDYE